MTEQPATEQPATEQPATEQPATEQPATEQPVTERPASEQPASEQPVIRVSAVLAVDDEGRMLVVRKRGTTMWMQPGGKPEPGETPAETLARELREELGLSIHPDALEPLGQFTTAAANEARTTLVADVFRTHLDERAIAQLAPAAEIDAVQWMHPRDMPAHPVAPLIIEHMLALLHP